MFSWWQGSRSNYLHAVLEIPTGPPVRGRQLWRRTGNFLLIFLQFYVYDLRFKAWGPTTFLTEFQTLPTCINFLLKWLEWLTLTKWWPIQNTDPPPPHEKKTTACVISGNIVETSNVCCHFVEMAFWIKACPQQQHTDKMSFIWTNVLCWINMYVD